VSDSTDDFFSRYGDLELQRRMVMDRPRTEAFVDAIERTVRPGDRVLDLGCGTGVLAMAAARAGAEVVAIDRTEVSQTAANLIRQHGLSERVRVLRGDVRELQLAQPVDLLVSEWLGNFAFVEDMWPEVALARDRLLAPEGQVIPRAVELMLAPVDDPVLYFGQGPGQWRERMAGFDFAELERRELLQGRAHQLRIEPSTLLGPPLVVHRLEAAKDGEDDGWFERRVDGRFTRPGVVLGFAGWFRADLGAGVALDTGPTHPETHWSQTYLPWFPSVVSADESYTLSVSLEPHPSVAHNAQLTVGWRGESLRFHLE
jgi:SAM-dependent methyltransferase